MTPLPPVSVKYARNNNTRVAERVITGLIKARACAFGDANVLSLVACLGPRLALYLAFSLREKAWLREAQGLLQCYL